MNPEPITIPIIGIHRSPLLQKFGIPRQPNLVEVATRIEMLAPYSTPDAFIGLDDFSHLWISWQFHQNKPQANFRPQVRPPRLGGNDKLGVFATRSMYRPSSLGLSVVKLKYIEVIDRQVVLHISGADMLDGTPIIDIKPYIAYSDSLPEAVSGFASDKPSIKTVELQPKAQEKITQLIANKHLTQEDMEHIQALVAQDPRPAYRQQEVGSIFTMRYAHVDVAFMMDDNDRLVIIGLTLLDNPV